MSLRDEYVMRVRFAGKFQSEAPYIPYFWDASLDGCADYERGNVFGFYVIQRDVDIFPELAGRHMVFIAELENGFVVEIEEPEGVDDECAA